MANYHIKPYSNIAKIGLDKLDGTECSLNDNSESPDGILIRSTKLAEGDLNEGLKAISRAGVGVNNLPIDVCTKKGIVVFNTPGANANAVKELQLEYVVLTSVDRDDIKEDYGSTIWAETIKQIHHHTDDCTVEVLTPDFKGNKLALLKVFSANPEIFSHNVECVERISKNVRSQANWKRSLDVLSFAVDKGMKTKTGMMVGLGETNDEVFKTMEQVASLGVSIFTIGQYLQPTKSHIPVDRYVTEKEFIDYKDIGYELGFSVVESGPLVRSSYHADEQARLFSLKSERLF